MKLIQYKDKGKILCLNIKDDFFDEVKCSVCGSILTPIFYLSVEKKEFVCEKHIKPNIEYYKVIGVDRNGKRK